MHGIGSGRGAKCGDLYPADLFIQLDAAVVGAMQSDRDDRHTRAERRLTPPPKGYVDDMEADSAPND